MKEELLEKDKVKKKPLNNMAVMGLALGLPSLIIGLFGIIYQLVENGVFGWSIGFTIFIAVILNTLYLMVRYVVKK